MRLVICASFLLVLLTPSPPRDQKDVALLNLANVQHQSGHSKEAVISVRMALEISPNSGIMHYMIANVYAVSGAGGGVLLGVLLRELLYIQFWFTS